MLAIPSYSRGGALEDRRNAVPGISGRKNGYGRCSQHVRGFTYGG